MSGVEGQLQAHLKMAMNTGLTEEQLLHLFELIEKQIGQSQAVNARASLSKITYKKE